MKSGGLRLNTLDKRKKLNDDNMARTKTRDGYNWFMIETLKELLSRRPFIPFRVILSSGDSFEVRHPEFAWLTKGGLYIGLPEAEGNGAGDLSDRAMFCSALHLAGIEQLVGR